MNPNLNPTPLQIHRHKKGWRLNRVERELRERGTPISWPTLSMIDHGFRTVITRNKSGKKIREFKKSYNPRPGYLMILAKLFNVKDYTTMYEDRSKE